MYQEAGKRCFSKPCGLTRAELKEEIPTSIVHYLIITAAYSIVQGSPLPHY